MNYQSIAVSEEDINQRLDIFLTKHHNDIGSRSHAQKLISDKKVKVNSEFVKASYRISIDDKIMVIDPIEDPKIAIDLKAEQIPIEVVYEDNDIIVVNKPVGLVTHPSLGNPSGTLVNALLHKIKIEDGLRPGIVHRLDKDTSGLLVVAKNLKSQRELSLQFKEKSARRIYWALCFGRLKENAGTIESFLDRHPKDRKKFSSSDSSSGKHAITHFKVLISGEISLVELKLETGRTHQIRVHLSEKGHPIFGDPIYGQSKRLNGISDPILKARLKKVKRMALVAKKLELSHPVTKEKMLFSVDWPSDFESLFDE